MTDASVKCPIS